MNREKIFKEIFKDVDENERKLIEPLMEEAIFLEKQMVEVKKLPFITYNPKNPAQQRKTEAAKLYKELCANYANIIRILLNTLRKIENGAADELLDKLKEFSL